MAKLSDDINEEDRLSIYKVCKQYLGDIWEENNLIIKRFSVGYFNKIFYCELLDEKHSNTNYKSVVIKFSLSEEFFLYNPLNSLICHLSASEQKLIPKILAVFPGGTINQYIESRTYNHLDDYNPIIVGLLARKLAKFHSLKTPIPRDGTKRWIKKVFTEFLEDKESYSITDELFDIILKSKYQTIKRLDFDDEYIWLRDTINNTEKILVFSHCDFNRGNVLVQENNQTLDLYLIDLDFTSYNFRGIDFGRYFSSWRHIDPNFGNEIYPKDEEMNTFIDAYIDESNRLTGDSFSKSKSNSKENLIKETKLFTLAGIMIDISFCLYMSGTNLHNETILDEFLSKAENRYSFYKRLKEKFQKESSLP